VVDLNKSVRYSMFCELRLGCQHPENVSVAVHFV